MGLFGFGKKKKVEEAPPKRTPVEKPVERHPMERIDENGQPVFESRLDKRSILWEDHTICKSDFTSVFSSCLGKAFTVQMRMGRSVIGEETRLNLREGLVTIDNQHYPCGYIGLESEAENMWVWGWHEDQPLPNMILVKRMRRFGKAWGVHEFTEPVQEITEQINGEHMAMVTCGLSATSAGFLPVPIDDGVVYVWICNMPTEVFAPADCSEFVENVMECISEYPIDHSAFLRGYLYWNKTPYEWRGSDLVAHFAEGDVVFCLEDVDGKTRLKEIRK